MAVITEEVAELEQEQGWEELFAEIKSISSDYNLSCQVAKSQANRHKNRYRDVSPFDHSRVKLLDGPSDYINSSLVDMKNAGRRYILSQGPLPATAGHFWQMVWEQNSKAVIMLNKIMEKGMVKCHQYWPVSRNNPMAYHDVGYVVSLIKETDMGNFMIREIELLRIQTEEKRVVYHFHYTAWPDFDVPQSPASFLDFLACIREYGVLESNSGPSVIHCSAGIGRSGTFVLVDTCLEFLGKGVPFSIRETLLEMRRYRMGLIQTPHQLRFSYFAIAECERILLFKQGTENNYSDLEVSSCESEDFDHLYSEEVPHSEKEDFNDNILNDEIINETVVSAKTAEEIVENEYHLSSDEANEDVEPGTTTDATSSGSEIETEAINVNKFDNEAAVTSGNDASNKDQARNEIHHHNENYCQTERHAPVVNDFTNIPNVNQTKQVAQNNANDAQSNADNATEVTGLTESIDKKKDTECNPSPPQQNIDTDHLETASSPLEETAPSHTQTESPNHFDFKEEGLRKRQISSIENKEALQAEKQMQISSWRPYIIRGVLAALSIGLLYLSSFFRT